MLKRFLQRWIKPRFWVCEWKAEKLRGSIFHKSGEFACLGDTYDEAKDDACDFVRRQLSEGERAILSIRPATWLERVNTPNVELTGAARFCAQRPC